MKSRRIAHSIIASDVQMGPITLKQPVPIQGIDQVDPFLLLHHVGPKTQEPGAASILGIGAHPHRGFEPVTFIFKGDVHHRDSHGNDSIIRGGGVQWMTAGSGIVHSESASEQFVAQGGELELIQLWVNLPSHLKMVEPRYQGFQQADIPTFTDQDDAVQLNVIAGKFEDLQGPVDSLTGVTAYTICMKSDSTIRIPLEASQNPLLYQLHGNALVNEHTSTDHSMTTFQSETGSIDIHAKNDSLFLLVAGRAIEEPVAQYGPFVMNRQEELSQAVVDFRAGKMGDL